jgi:GTP cyclohydrolase II
MLMSLDVRTVRVMTNNPNKLQQLESYGITVAGRIPHVLPPTKHNRFYLETKAKRSGHFIDLNAVTGLAEQSDSGFSPESSS